MKSSMTAMICVMGVFLIGLLGLSQADVDPGETAQEDIRDIIKDGVNSDSITFWELNDNVLQEKMTLSKACVCTKITKVHNDFNAEELGGLTIRRNECLRAFLHPLNYNADRLNFWAGTHCGEWSMLTALVMPDNAEWDVAPQPPPQTITQDVTYSHRGQTPGAFNRVDGTVSNKLYCYIMHALLYTQINGNDLFCNRVILEDMIQRTQLTTRAIRALCGLCFHITDWFCKLHCEGDQD